MATYKISKEQYQNIKKLMDGGARYEDAKKKYGASATAVSFVKKSKNYEEFITMAQKSNHDAYVRWKKLHGATSKAGYSKELMLKRLTGEANARIVVPESVPKFSRFCDHEKIYMMGWNDALRAIRDLNK